MSSFHFLIENGNKNGMMPHRSLVFGQSGGDARRYLGDSSQTSVDGGSGVTFQSFIGNIVQMDAIRKMIGGYRGWLSIGIVFMFLVFIGLFYRKQKDKPVY